MDNEEIQGVKFSEFPSATPDNTDEVVGLHTGDNARFSVADFVLAIRQGLTNIFVPLTRKINGRALSSDITLDASDVGAVDTAYVGVADGVASLDSNGKVPGTQLNLSGKQDTITANGILKGDGQGGVSAAVAGTDYASASAVASLNERYTDNTTWQMNADANDFKTSGFYAMGSGNSNIPMPWGILCVLGPISDTIEQEYRYMGNIWNREFRNNAWSAWTLVSSVGHKFGNWTPVNAVAAATDRCCYVVSANTVTIYMALTLTSALAATNTVTLFSNINNTIGKTIDASMGVNAVPVVVQAYNQASRIALLYYNSNSLILSNTTGSSIGTVDATIYGQITLPLA